MYTYYTKSTQVSFGMSAINVKVTKIEELEFVSAGVDGRSTKTTTASGPPRVCIRI